MRHYNSSPSGSKVAHATIINKKALFIVMAMATAIATKVKQPSMKLTKRNETNRTEVNSVVSGQDSVKLEYLAVQSGLATN